MSKTIDDHFTDWESDTFGFGYGTGEEHTLKALKQFMELCCKGQYAHAYDHQELEAALTPTVAWLLINILASDDKIEYGTSPRYGWLTPTGEALAKFVRARTVEQLYDLTGKCDGDNYIHCYPEHCNCNNEDCRGSNPFWAVRS